MSTFRMWMTPLQTSFETSPSFGHSSEVQLAQLMAHTSMHVHLLKSGMLHVIARAEYPKIVLHVSHLI